MKYLLDTCVVSDFVKGEKNTLDKLQHIPPNEITISSITVMEIQYGIALNPKHRKIIEPVILDLFASISLLDFNENDAVEAAKIRAVLKQQGQPIGSYDVLTNLTIHAVKEASSVDYVVAQLMASQNTKGIIDQFGGEVYSRFTPLCAGFNLDEMKA